MSVALRQYHPIARQLLQQIELGDRRRAPALSPKNVARYSALIRDRHAQDNRLCLSLLALSRTLKSRGMPVAAEQFLHLSRIGLIEFAQSIAFCAQPREMKEPALAVAAPRTQRRGKNGR
jgi:hypothetical protein